MAILWGGVDWMPISGMESKASTQNPPLFMLREKALLKRRK
jgi:hypothetical protein